MTWAIYAMVYLGSALMVYNIIGFVRFARYIRGMKLWRWGSRILDIPIALLVSFLLGYLMVGFFGRPDLLVAGILFGGSIFVFVMVRLISSIIQKVFEIEHLEAELLAAEQSNRVKASFLATVSHEMRTPMNVILGQNTLALKNPDLHGETRQHLEKISASAHHLSDLINGMLDMQQIENGELVIHSEPFSLREAMEQVDVLAGAMCEEKGLTYQSHFAEAARGEYTGDAARLKQALMCLLDNAVKFTDAPGTVRFDVESTEAGDGVVDMRFIVSDTGVGIDEAFLPRIFEAFAQEDASFTNRFGGSGIGLPVAKAFVTHMGGTIGIDSRKGEGSTFTIALPMRRSVSEDSGNVETLENEAVGPEETPSTCLAGRRVLVVDDMAGNVEIVSDLLELEDVACDTADNGQAAVDRVAASEMDYYDAILMDLRMPVMDGMEAARRIRALDRSDAKKVPIIALTANAHESDVQNSLQAGMNDHLVKPVDADKLYVTLGKWINNGKGKED